MLQENRAQWLQERRKGIGGADCAVVMGLSPWKTKFQLYQEKRGEVKEWDGNAQANWGTRVEPALRQFYSDVTGRTVRLPEKILYNAQYPFMLGSLDGFTDCRRVVELKTAMHSKGWGNPGTAEVPDAYALQTQHYLIVTGFKVADIVVSIAGASPEIYEVPEDPEIQEMIIAAETEFWARVIDGNPPDPVSYSDAVQRYSLSDSAGIVLAPPEIIDSVSELRAIRDSLKELEAKEEKLKGKIIIAIGEVGDALVNSTGELLATYKISKGRKSLDIKLLEKEEPVVYNKYLRIGVSIRRFLLK
jgi:putative phage-type endonuclease